MGHAKLLWGRKSIENTLRDPSAPADLKAKLEVVEAARSFSFDRLALRRSKEYSTYSMVGRPYLTFLVTGCEKLAFKPYLWHFPLAGTFPYKGHFKEADAKREADQLAAKGYDAYVRGVAAYNTPLPFSDPVPSTVLGYRPGDLAELIIHELTHSTVYFKNQTEFDESLATFVGSQGAREFLDRRYGPDSPELKAYLKGQDDDVRCGREFERIYGELDAVYRSSATDSEKLARREVLFAAGLERLKAAGFAAKTLNNAVLLAHRVYHQDLSLFRKAFETQGGDWPKTIAFFGSLDKKDPYADLKRRLGD